MDQGPARGDGAPGDRAAEEVLDGARRGLVAPIGDEELAGEPLDVEAREALLAMREILDSAELAVELTIQRGQVQLINNRAFA
ncbi:MAG TPA: hypothetical protein VFB67_09720, partial [Candidatus Polarisedimenticolaceae bacterium]|nr:hypothetical protein [Candidatus Polarisedimenticolaceae bacterium]